MWEPHRLPTAQSSGIPSSFGTKHYLCVGFQDGLSKNCLALLISPVETDDGRLIHSSLKLLEEMRNFLAVSCSRWRSQTRLCLNLNWCLNWCFLVVIPEIGPCLVLCDLTCCCSELDTLKGHTGFEFWTSGRALAFPPPPPKHSMWTSLSLSFHTCETGRVCSIFQDIRIIGTQIGSYRPRFRFINWLKFSKPLIGQKGHVSWGLWSVWTRPIMTWCWTSIWGWILEDCLASRSSLLCVPHYAVAKASFWARGFRDHICTWGL